MTDSSDLPVVGIALDHVYQNHQSYALADPSKELTEDGEMTFGWDWRIASPEVFEVVIQIRVAPSRERPEEAVVSTVGVFRRVGEIQEANLVKFAGLGAPSLLLPYLREALASLTGRGAHGPMYLPPLNVVALMKTMTQSPPTGVQQIQRGDLVAVQFGVVEAQLASPATLE